MTQSDPKDPPPARELPAVVDSRGLRIRLMRAYEHSGDVLPAHYADLAAVLQALPDAERAALLAPYIDAPVPWTDDEIGRYEVSASLFRAATGLMAPGKDEPLAMNSTHTQEERRAAWDEWRSSRAFTDALTRIVRLENKREALTTALDEAEDRATRAEAKLERANALALSIASLLHQLVGNVEDLIRHKLAKQQMDELLGLLGSRKEEP